MPPRPRNYDDFPEQGSMFAVDSEHVFLQPRDFESIDEAGSLIERDIHQLNVLSLFGALNQREFMISHPDILARQYGNGASNVLTNLKNQRFELQGRAALEFCYSLGLPYEQATFINRQDVELDPGQRDIKRWWNQFQSRFRGPSHTAERNAYGCGLRLEIEDLQSRSNRAQELRPHLGDTQRQKRELPELSSAQRLIVIKEDPRAGFMPTNNDEKTLIMSWLDYLDNPAYEFGVANQLMEVFNRQQRVIQAGYEGQHGKELATKTVQSAVYRVHDYWTNAIISLQTLRDLEGALAECLNPSVSLTEDIPSHPGFRPLIRGRDLARFRDSGQTPHGIKDPLLNREDRRLHEDPDKRKTMEDIYTRRIYDEEMRAYIENEAALLTVGEARKLIIPLIRDQEAREAFHGDRLRDLSIAPDSRIFGIRRLAGRLITQSRILPVETVGV